MTSGGWRTGRTEGHDGTAACRERDRAVFAGEVDRLMDRLYGTAVRLTRDQTRAEDLVAEAIVKAWSGFGRLEDRDRFEKWLFRILINTYISDRRRRRETPLSDMSDGLDEDGGDDQGLFDRLHQPFLLWWGNPEQQVLDRLLRADIEKALDALPDGYRVVIVMVDVQGFSYAEVADALSVPVGTVRSRLNRARMRMQNALWRQARQRGIGGTRGKDD